MATAVAAAHRNRLTSLLLVACPVAPLSRDGILGCLNQLKREGRWRRAIELVEAAADARVMSEAERWRWRVKMLPPARAVIELQKPDAAKHLGGTRRGLLKQARRLTAQIRVRACSQVWYEDVARDAVSPNLPPESHTKGCPCKRCTHGREHKRWPAYYGREGVSWECWIEQQSEWFKHALPGGNGVVVRMRKGDSL